jgi:phosphoglycolate phosphatase
VGEGARRLVERALGDVPPAVVEEGLARFMVRYGAHLLDATRPYPGVVDVLDALTTRGVVLSVLTNKPEAMSRAILQGLGLGRRFVGVVGGDSLPTRKPDSAGIDHLLALGGTARAELLLVGDSGIDVHTARAARVGFCGVAWGFAPDTLQAAGATRVVSHPAELLAVVCGG